MFLHSAHATPLKPCLHKQVYDAIQSPFIQPPSRVQSAVCVIEREFLKCFTTFVISKSVATEFCVIIFIHKDANLHRNFKIQYLLPGN